jgi:SAM-dependent methyltransferase
MGRISLAMHSTHPKLSVTRLSSAKTGYCWACGKHDVRWQFKKVIDEALSSQWGLNDAQRAAFDERESAHCENCGCSYRQRQLAQAISLHYGSMSLSDAVNGPMKNGIFAEINSCGFLHQFFQNLPVLEYSEYGSTDVTIPSENLEALTYESDMFDAVFTSDTFEHLPDVDAGHKEVWRVLKPGGIHFFTVPVLWRRSKTLKRTVKNSDGSIENNSPPSYHGEGQPDYLVCSEFGQDIIDTVEANGFTVSVFGLNLLNLNDASGVIIAQKKSQKEYNKR